MKNIVAGVIAAALIIGLFLGSWWLIMVAWNAVVPAVFGLGALSYWQTVALWFLVFVVANMLKPTTRKPSK